MDKEQQATQLLGVNVYNWTVKAWDEAAENTNVKPSIKKWRDLNSGFQRYLLDRTKGCTTFEETKQALEAK